MSSGNTVVNGPQEGVNNRSHICIFRRPWRWGLAMFPDIQNSARSSCHLCNLVEQVILALVDGKLLDVTGRVNKNCKSLADLEVIRLDEDGQLQLNIGLSRFIIQLFRDIEDETNFTVEGYSFPAMSRFEAGTKSDRTFRNAEQWLRQCLTTHKCGDIFPSRLPKRLLDIQGDHVQLLETTGIEAPYVCLSHRWGGNEHRQMFSTVATVHEHMKGISWSNLPKTFQDAVTICRRLKVNYLWIDALCILQDSNADFAEENSAMAKIYQNCYFSISADISTNMESGIFSSWPAAAVSYPAKVRDDSGNIATVYARGETVHEETPTDLETRGWTFQEFLLPPRVLHFNHFDITWRCQESHACECGYVTDEANGRYPSWRDSLAKVARPLAQKLDFQWWATVVHHYTVRKLSNQHDKLPALSGLAQLYHTATGDTYRAGLWEGSLSHDLCWFYGVNFRVGHTHSNPPARRVTEFRAPSWSWASTDILEDVECLFWSPECLDILRPVCYIRRVVCLPKTKDPTGEVDPNCYIEMEATLIPAVITSGRGPAVPWTLGAIENGFLIGTGGSACWPDCGMEDDDMKIGDTVYCAPILKGRDYLGYARSCLILKHLGAQKYRRIGFCLLVWPQPGNDAWLYESRTNDTVDFNSNNFDTITIL
ncbi:heterokaryon incompatibility protein-domain-containing protein [Hypomontagnella monticulosa]|nr:heterokaryon incompatibility protein-domain-containing protein [Hypomontagnella monticulosa]